MWLSPVLECDIYMCIIIVLLAVVVCHIVCRDPEGLRTFYYLVQDLKCLVFSLIGLHFKINPI